VSVRNNGDSTFTWTFDQPVGTDGEPVPANTLQIYDDASDSWFDSFDPAVPVGPMVVIVPCSAYPGSAWRIIGDPGGVGVSFDPPPLIPQSGSTL
jgi:hypothetical protein